MFISLLITFNVLSLVFLYLLWHTDSGSRSQPKRGQLIKIHKVSGQRAA